LLVGTEVPEPFLTEEARRANLTNEGGVRGTIRLLKNVTGLWFIQRLKQAFASRGLEMDYPEMATAASSAKPFRRFINTETGIFHNPPDMMKAIDQYLVGTGQPAAETPGEYARCVCESLAYMCASVLERLERITGKEFARVHIVGGGARNDLLNSFIADASGKEVLAGPVEATAIGNGLMQALSEGLFGSVAEMRSAVGSSFEVREFQPTAPEKWKKNLCHYREIALPYY
jgi:rhamnulokinase